MKNQESRRLRSIATNLFLLVPFLVWAGCDSASQPANAPSVDETSGESVRPTDQESNAESEEVTTRDDDTASSDNAAAPASVTEENTADSASPASPPAAAQTPAMSSEAFLMAAGEGRTEDVKRGLDSGMNIEASEIGRGHTALHHAAYNGHTATVLFLVEQGATLDSRDHEGKTPLLSLIHI